MSSNLNDSDRRMATVSPQCADTLLAQPADAKPPLVSIVMPVYNRDRYLAVAIGSVLNQTYRDFELLIWDDGSTDRSLDIAREYAQQDDRVRVIAAAHQGTAHALKGACAAAKGTYVGQVDSAALARSNKFSNRSLQLTKRSSDAV